MIPSPSDQVKRIAEVLEDEKERVDAVRDLHSANDLVALAYCYNWDDGMAIPRSIAEHPDCDLGTALHLFQLAEGITWMTSDDDWPYQQEWASFCRDISAMISGGSYTRVVVPFEPQLTKIQILKAQKAGVPNQFLTAVHPE